MQSLCFGPRGSFLFSVSWRYPEQLNNLRKDPSFCLWMLIELDNMPKEYDQFEMEITVPLYVCGKWRREKYMEMRR